MKPNQNPMTQWLSGLKAMALALVVAVLALTGCNDDSDNNAQPTETIVALAQGNPNLSTLVTALTKYPDLVSTLNGSGNFTVFAPTNAAFTSLLTAIGQPNLDEIPEDVLREILLYHVVTGNAVLSTQLINGDVPAANGDPISVNISSGVRLNNSANVVAADVRASNGVVHVVDAVLVPPAMRPIIATIVAPAFFNRQFTTLVAAIRAASPEILTALLSPERKTLFAPTNAAFAAAGITSLPDRATLDAVLTYHVLAGEVRAADITNGSSSAQTLGGGRIYLSKGSNGVFINGTSQVTTTDIGASNGVVHIINRTLIPPTQTIAQIAVAASTSGTPEFTQLVAAVVKVPAILEAAGAPGNLTLFAPTDAAFRALYASFSVNSMDELEAKIGNANLAKVLQHHIVGARVFSTDLSSGSVPTLNQELTVNVSNLTITDASSSTPAANLVRASLNIHATNGVIHVIDKVLLPNL
ncbi:MAG: fasciclin domain-containing protein [Cyclobacteriaceae bacterium]|nr:fasciclin domain-containing protein [Cyclobacteriaceae bacterium]